MAHTALTFYEERSSHLTDAKYRVLICLAARCNTKEGKPHWCYPSIPFIAERTGRTERSVMRVLRALEEDGEIATAYRSSHRGTNVYYVLRYMEFIGESVLEEHASDIKVGDTSVGQTLTPVSGLGDTSVRVLGDTSVRVLGDTSDTETLTPVSDYIVLDIEEDIEEDKPSQSIPDSSVTQPPVPSKKRKEVTMEDLYAANASNNKKSAILNQDRGSWLRMVNEKLEPSIRMPIVNTVAEICGQLDSLEMDSLADWEVKALHVAAVSLYEALSQAPVPGASTSERLKKANEIRLQDDWQRTNRYHPKPADFVSFVKGQLKGSKGSEGKGQRAVFGGQEEQLKAMLERG